VRLCSYARCLEGVGVCVRLTQSETPDPMWIRAALPADALGSNRAERRTNRPATKARVASFSGTCCLHQGCIHSVAMGWCTGQRQSRHREVWFVDTGNAVLEQNTLPDGRS